MGPRACIGGVFFLPRVVVFVDYQNVYMQARRCFRALTAGTPTGQIDPLRLGSLLVQRSASGGELQQVRVYRGQPHPVRDARAFSPFKAQVDTWHDLDPRVRLLTRPLRYPRDWPRSRPQEKGIDVLLAIDFVQMAVQREYDVGILMSHDTDLAPALEAVVRLGSGATGQSVPRCEVAAWAGSRSPQRLRVPGAAIWCHYLTAADFAIVADARDYRRP
jgi:uncharacterized LabA/DUF88 family protein